MPDINPSLPTDWMQGAEGDAGAFAIPKAPINSNQGLNDDAQDTPDLVAIARMCEQQYKEARAWWAPVRRESKQTREFYDGVQWEKEQERQLEREGRPATVINQIAKAVDNITGRERGGRYDWKAQPTCEGTVPRADEVTHGLKHIANQTNVKYEFSDAFEDVIKGPQGWLDVGIDDADPTTEPIIGQRVDPDEMMFDPFSKRRDFSDCRYQIRERVVDLDSACEAYAGKADALRAAVVMEELSPKEDQLGDYDNINDGRPHVGFSGSLPVGEDGRQRVRIREHWFWKMEDDIVLVMPNGEVYDYDQDDASSHDKMMQGGQPHVAKLKKFYLAVVAAGVVLSYEESPYPYRRFPYVPLWGKRDVNGRPYGLIRVMMPSQRELNVSRSRFNESIRSRMLVYRKGSLGTTTVDQVRKALSRANFVLEVSDPSGIQITTDKPDTALWANLMETSRKEIDDVVGNNDAAYGDRAPTATSGVAKQMDVQQQSLNLSLVFDNLRWSRIYVGEMFLALAQKFWTPQKWARVIEAQVIQNKSQLDLSWIRSPEVDAISQMKFDVQIDDKSETATTRQAEMQQRIEVLTYIPEQFKATYIPDLIRASDWVGAEEMAGKLEQMMNTPPPPVAPPPPKPPSELISYKDAPEDIRRQMEAQASMQPSQIPPGTPGNPRDLRKEALGTVPLTSPSGPPPPQAAPPPPPPLDPNKALQELGKHGLQSQQHQHEMRMALLQQQHEASMAQAAQQAAPTSGAASSQE